MPVITVSGQVSSINSEKYNYLKVWETFDFKGQPRHRLWTAWLDSAVDVNEGDTVEITGDLSTKVGTYNKPGDETKQIVEHALNNCNVKVTKFAVSKTAADDVELPF